MEFIIFFIFIIFTVQTDLLDFPNPFTTIKYFVLNSEINDVFFDDSYYYILNTNGVTKVNYNSNQTNSFTTDTLSFDKSSSLMYMNDTFFFACYKGYLLGVYNSDLSTLLVNHSYEGGSNSPNKYKCSISYINDYVIVGHVDEFSYEDEDQLSFYAYLYQKEGSSYVYRNKFGLTQIKNDTDKITPMINCIGLIKTPDRHNLICIFLNNQPRYFIANYDKDYLELPPDTTEINPEDKDKYIEEIQFIPKYYSEMKVMRTSDTNYLIAGIDTFDPNDYGEYDVQHHVTFILTSTGNGFELGELQPTTELLPETVISYSGHVFSLTDYFVTYYDPDGVLNIEKVKIADKIRTTTEAFDFSVFNKEVTKITFTHVKNDLIHLITEDERRIIIYIFEYPGTIKCTNDTIRLIFNSSGEYNLNKMLKEYPPEFKVFPIVNINFDFPANIDNNYIAYFSVENKTKFSEEEEIDYYMVFSFKKDDVYFYSHDCNVTVKICHDNCAECKALPDSFTSNPSNCTETKCAPFNAYLSDDPSNCYPNETNVEGYVITNNENKKIFYKCYETCETCIGEKDGTADEQYCDTCKPGYAESINDGIKYCLICPETTVGKWTFSSTNFTHCHYNKFEDCPSNAPLFVKNATICVQQCPLEALLLDDKKCVASCEAPNKFKIEFNKTCVSSCPTNYYEYNDNECVSECPAIDTPYIDNKKCVASCTSKKILQNKFCVDECPPDYYLYDNIYCESKCPEDAHLKDGNKCVSFCPIKSLNNEICVNECPSEFSSETDNQCECIYGSYSINDDGEITCDNVADSNIYKVYIGFECINYLQSSGQIINENDIKIKKIITPREGEIVNQLDYQITKTDGNALNLESCKDIKLTSPIDTTYPGLDLEKVKATSKEGYDIFNPADDFFNDVCSKFKDEDGADVPIKVRRQEYYQEFALCESGCKYSNYDINTNSVDCICEYKSYTSTLSTFSVIETDSNFKNEDISNSNFKTMGCGKEVFKNLGSNSGFLIILVGFLVQVGCTTIFSVFKTKIINILLFDAFKIVMVANPQEIKNKENDIIGDNVNDEHYQDKSNTHAHCHNEINEVNIYHENNITEEISEEDKMTHEGLNNMSYENALLYDDRTFFAYFWNIFIYNQMLLFIIFKDNWNFVITKISMFVNIITFALFFNVMLFGNKLIKEIYENKGGLTMNKAFGWIVLSTVLTVILNCIAKIFGLTKRDVDNAKKDKEHFNDEQFSSLVFKRTIIYFIVCIVFTLFIWYFGLSFSAIYKECQTKLVFYIFMTWLLIMLYPILLCLLVAIFRHIGLKKQIKGLFTFSKGIQWIIFV